MTKRTSHEDAERVMLAAGFQPNVPYRGNLKPWPGVCLGCGQPGSPRYADVQQGGGACGYCAGKKVDASIAEGKMLAADFQPSIPYQGSLKPWPGVCLTCGQPGSPAYNSVKQGRRPCAYCAGNKIDSVVAEGKMLAAAFQPSAPYPGALKPWRGVCVKCGQPGSPAYSNIRAGYGPCSTCAPNGYNPSRPGVFYAVTDGHIVKGGISNVKGARLRVHRKQGLTEVLHVLHFGDGTDAVSVEREWMAYVSSQPSRRVTRDRLADGHTEALYMHDGLLDFIDELVSRWTLEAAA